MNRMKDEMKRVSFNLTVKQIKLLKKISEQTDVPLSALIRRAINDKYNTGGK